MVVDKSRIILITVEIMFFIFIDDFNISITFDLFLNIKNLISRCLQNLLVIGNFL